jgi:long-chain acyl-CoA synthetase
VLYFIAAKQIMLTFADPLQHACELAPDVIAVIDGQTQLSFREFAERGARLAGALRRLGLIKGDRVAILAKNCHEYLEAYVALPAAGFIIVPLNTRLASAELEYVLEDSDCRVLLSDREVGAFSRLAEHTIRLGEPYEELLAAAEPAALGADVSEHDLAALFYTGGTTGRAKGVMLTHRNIIANTCHNMMFRVPRQRGVFLIMAPLFHVAGSAAVLINIWRRVTQVLLPTFAAGAALDLIAAHGVTDMTGIPTMLGAIAEEQRHRPRRIDSIQCIRHGGSPIATDVLRRVHAVFPRADLLQVYGTTEICSSATALPEEQTLLEDPRVRSCGMPIAGVRVRVLDPAGCPLPRGQIGEIVVRGPNVMSGYWRKPAETAAVLKEGEFWTGDLGYMDSAGYVFLVDRSKDMIVSGGENVYSTEVEDVLHRHPAVLEAAVFGVPHDIWGEAVHAVVVPRSEHTSVEARELIEFCRSFIGGYKIPKSVDIRLEPLPKSGAGKILKRELRAPYWAGHGRAVH